MMDIHYLSATELAGEIGAGRLSSLEVVSHLIDRIEAHDGAVNAVVVRDFERALAAAADADARLARGERQLLQGVPMLVKESFDLAGKPTTWGFAWGRDAIADFDAIVVGRLKAAGAVVLGKSNAMEGLWDWQTYNPVYGTTNNPWDPLRSPGGSSGGSSAALAAGFAPMELGSDIGGSLRVPAHFCGVCAHKPSWGVVPGTGHSPPGARRSPFDFGGDMGVCGPMARSAADLGLMFEVLAQPDERARGKAFRVSFRPARAERLADFRVLLLDTDGLGLLPLADEVAAGVEDFAHSLEAAGASVARHTDLVPDLVEQARVYQHLIMAFSGSFMPPEVYRQVAKDAAALDPDDRSFRAARMGGTVSSHRDWQAANGQRHGFAVQWSKLFETYDVVIKPPFPVAAFPHDQSPIQENRLLEIDGVSYDYLDLFGYTGVATAPGLPATVVPIGVTPSGLPMGIEIVGPFLEDLTPLAFARAVEREFGGFAPPPGW
jgi:amidase